MNISIRPLSDETLLGVALFVAVLLSGAVQYFNIFSLAALGGLISFCLLWRSNWIIHKDFTWVYLPLFFYIVYSIFLDISISGLIYIFFRLFDFFYAFIIINFALQRNIKFIPVLYSVIKIFAIHAFINWCVANLFFSLFSSSEQIKSSQFLYFFFAMSEQYFGVHRSQGLFWEPGILQIYMNFGLLLSLFLTKSTRWSIFFLLNILLTQSTTGITISAALLALFFFRKGSRLTVYSLVNSLLIFVLLVFFLFFTAVAIEEKFVGDRVGSFLARSYDLQVGLSVIRDYPLGIGFNPQNYLYFAENEIYGINLGLEPSRAQTNGWLILLISSGLFWGALIFYRLIFQNMLPDNRLAAFSVFFPSLLTEPVIFSPFTLLFFLYPKTGRSSFQ